MKIVLLLAALNSLAGTWLGTVRLAQNPTPVRIEISNQDKPQLSGTLTMPYDGLNNVQLSQVTIDGSDLILEHKGEASSFLFRGMLRGTRFQEPFLRKHPTVRLNSSER